MITYEMTKVEGPLYIYLYKCLKADISAGNIKPGEKMPSKRSLAKNLGVSTITIENAYGQLASEGYIFSEAKKGWYVADISEINKIKAPADTARVVKVPKPDENLFDLSSNKPETESFPFSVWSRLVRETLSGQAESLLRSSESTGVKELREAIAGHLSSYRAMKVNPDQIIVGAGTEYLYSLIINLLGREKIYCVENPGYKKPKQIYESNDVKCVHAGIDESGIMTDEIRKLKADIIHISPTHHFPTGITMPVSRRYELLAWANEKDGRYIIEDDYDSEFRLSGMPISPLYNIDACEKVIYMNTFSKSLAPTIRISYMVLPGHLINRYFEKLSFYSCTVSTFEQYMLASFIADGYFEKHINRMRLYYGKKRKAVMDIVKKKFSQDKCRIMENDSGLHFNILLNTKKTDAAVKKALAKEGISIKAVSDFYHDDERKDLHTFIFNYSDTELKKLPEIIGKMNRVLS